MAKTHKKSFNKKNYKRTKSPKLFVIGALLLAIALSLGLITKYNYPLFIQSPSINKLIVEDPSLARNATERKAMEELNNAANADARAKTPKEKEKAAVDLYITGKVVADLANDPTPSTTASQDSLEKKAKEKLIENGVLSGDINNPTITPKYDYTKNTPALPTTPVSPITPTNPGCVQGTFGCPYEEGFVYTGDEKCGNHSVAGYYCWPDAKGEGHLYVINLPDTMDEYAKKLAAAEGKLADYTGDGTDKGKEQYLNSLGIYDDATIKRLGAKLKDTTSPPGSVDGEPGSAGENGSVEPTIYSKVDTWVTDPSKCEYSVPISTGGTFECVAKGTSGAHDSSYWKNNPPTSKAIESYADSKTCSDKIKSRSEVKCIPVQGLGYGVVSKDLTATSVSYNTGATAGRPTTLDPNSPDATIYKNEKDCAYAVRGGETCDKVVGTTTYKIISDTSPAAILDRKKYLKFEFGNPAAIPIVTPPNQTTGKNIGKECPKDYLSCSGFCDKNSEGRFASHPEGGKIICDEPPAVSGQTPATPANPVTSTTRIVSSSNQCNSATETAVTIGGRGGYIECRLKTITAAVGTSCRINLDGIINGDRCTQICPIGSSEKGSFHYDLTKKTNVCDAAETIIETPAPNSGVSTLLVPADDNKAFVEQYNQLIAVGGSVTEHDSCDGLKECVVVVRGGILNSFNKSVFIEAADLTKAVKDNKSKLDALAKYELLESRDSGTFPRTGDNRAYHTKAYCEENGLTCVDTGGFHYHRFVDINVINAKTVGTSGVKDDLVVPVTQTSATGLDTAPLTPNTPVADFSNPDNLTGIPGAPVLPVIPTVYSQLNPVGADSTIITLPDGKEITMVASGCGPSTAYNYLQTHGFPNITIAQVEEKFKNPAFWSCSVAGCGTDAETVLAVIKQFSSITGSVSERVVNLTDILDPANSYVWGGKLTKPNGSSLPHLNLMTNCKTVGGKLSCDGYDSAFSGSTPAKCSQTDASTMACSGELGTFTMNISETGGNPDALYSLP